MARTTTKVMAWARGQRTGHAMTKVVLMVLASHADRFGLTHPSTRTIADEAEMDQKTVRDHLGRLIAQGLVTVSRRGSGRATTQYLLDIDDVRSEGRTPSLAEPVVRAPSPSLQPDASEGSRPLTTDGRSEGEQIRSEGERRSDQQQSTPEVVPTELELQEEGAPPPHARGRAGGGAHTRAGRAEIVRAADLNDTAHSPTAHGLLTAWAERRPGHLSGHRRDLARAVQQLLDQRADPDLVPAALDRAHDDPQYRNPAKCLGYAYRDVLRERQGRATPITGGRPSTTTQRVQGALALLDPEGDHP